MSHNRSLYYPPDSNTRQRNESSPSVVLSVRQPKTAKTPFDHRTHQSRIRSTDIIYSERRRLVVLLVAVISKSQRLRSWHHRIIALLKTAYKPPSTTQTHQLPMRPNCWPTLPTDTNRNCVAIATERLYEELRATTVFKPISISDRNDFGCAGNGNTQRKRGNGLVVGWWIGNALAK